MQKFIFCIGIFILAIGIMHANPVTGSTGEKPSLSSSPSSDVKFGERPFIDIFKVPDDAMEKGMIRIKLRDEYSVLVENLEYREGIVQGFGISNLDELNQQYGVKEIAKLFYSPGPNNKFSWRHKQWGFHLWFELRFDNKADVREIVMAYRNLKDIVAWAEPEYKKVLFDSDNLTAKVLSDATRWVPNDPQLASQWHYNNTGQTGGTVDADIDLFEAWDIEKGNSAVVVCVEDQGIQIDHPDLAANMWINSDEIAGNSIDDDSNGYVDDVNGYNFADGTATISAGDHGCHTSGTIAAVTNNGVGVAGIAGGSGTGNGVRLMSCEVFSSSNSGFDVAPIYAADNGAAISQNSWGYTYVGVYDQPVLDAIDYFNINGGGSVMTGGITIFSAGNGSSTGQWYPCCYSGAFAVAATNHNDAKAWYSNFDTWVDVSAPGGETNSVTTEGVLSCWSGSSYGYYQGTSMACPHTSGLAALVISYANRIGTGLSNTDLAEYIMDNADPLSVYPGQMGSGRINAYNTLIAVVPGMPSCTITAPSAGATIDLNSIVPINVTATDSDGYITAVAFYIDDVLKYTDPASPYTWDWNTTGYSGGQHVIKAIATDNSSNSVEKTITITLIAPADEGFESGGFGAFAWNNTSAIPWTVQSAEKFSGIYAAKSGAITHSGLTSLSLQMTVSASGNISFWQKISSESGYDYLKFFIDGGTALGSWSGSGLWVLQTYPVTSGLHTFTWTYSKDGSDNAGSDCAWLDHIIFPPHGVYYAPPQNLTAIPSYGYVNLSWQAPATGSPTNYKIYRNSSLLITQTGLTYTDSAIVNGTSYSYYITAMYSSNESEPSNTAQATPGMTPPTNLIANSGNGFVNLSWTAAAGARAISGYKIYRNSGSLTTVTGTTYTDNSVVNETLYNYYVTTLYTSPAGESSASNTVQAIPSALTPTYITIGNGTSTQAYPLDRYYNYSAHEAIYLSTEINAAGTISSIAYYKSSGTDIADITPVTIYMKQTADASLVTGTYSTSGYTSVYSGAYPNNADSGWMEIELDNQFSYDGTSNLAILIIKGYQAWISTYPSWTYTTTGSTRARQNRDDYSAPTSLTASTNLPNLKLGIYVGQVITPPNITWNPAAFSQTLAVNQTASQTLSIGNTGDAALNYTLVKPAGETVILDESFENSGSIPVGWTQEYVSGTTDWTFVTGGFSGNPAAAYDGIYNAFLYYGSSTGITTKLISPVINLAGAASATLNFYHTQAFWSPDQDELKVYYRTSESGSWTQLAYYTSSITSWTLETIPLPDPNGTYYIAFEGNAKYGWGICIDKVTISKPNTSINWYSINGGNSYSNSIIGGGSNQNITIGFNSTGLAAGTYNSTMTLTSNSLINPIVSIPIQLIVTAGQSLDTPVVTISRISGVLKLDWEEINNATEYYIFASNNPFSGFTQIDTTSELSYEINSTPLYEFYYVQAANASARSINARQNK